MSSSIVDHERREEHQLSASPPSLLQAQESTKNASLLNQSPSSQSLSTSPHHHREFNASSPPATITSHQQRPTSSPSAFPATTKSPSTARPSYFSLHSVSLGIEARSPATKRAPASRSSHGIATTNGPPPALITQRSYHAEPWRTSFPNDPPKPAVDPSQHSPAPESGSTLPRRNSTITKTSGAAKSDAMNGTARRHRAASVAHDLYDEEAEEDDTLRTLGGTPRPSRALRHTHNGTGPADGHDEDHSYSSHEDLFLHLARTESEAGNNFDTKTRHSKRPSDVGLTASPSVRASRPWSTQPASSGRELGGEQPEEQMANWSRPSRFDPSMNSRQSPQRDRAYGASAHSLDAGKRRYQRSEASSKASYITPRADLVSGLPSRSHKHSGHSHVSGNHYDSSPLMNTAPKGNHQSHRPEGTESTASTTAPSTVWDELDDLKSRIRKLELTGKLPSSSGAAINGVVNGRPRTASTTMTTASLSPRRYRVSNTSPEASTVKDVETSSLHPLLHSALTKAKSLIDPKAFKALETTATDALTLAALTGNSNSTGQENLAGGSCHNLDRQIRRKADSMCRSLTELCIALSEEQSSKERSAASRPGSSRAVNDIQTSESPQNFRATSQEPERSSSRIMSRLEARRTSLMAAKNAATPLNNNTSQNESPLTHQDVSTPTQPSSRIDRSSSAFFYRRRTIDANATDAATSRPASRVTTANTEQQRPSLATRLSSTTTEQRPSLATRLSSRTTEQRPSPGTRLPREYTSQHPLPAQRSPSVRSSLPSTTTRRSYFPSNSPSTPQGNGAVLQPGSKRYLSSTTTERQTPPSSSSATENNARIAQARQERVASLGQYGGSSRLRLVEGEEAEPGS
ncbi:MAG: hypothetical protein LQ344_002774 [Seirophora lacunosa]|nr:MAG: hypothetical protein LQ344_002774 [Seirophora lacunosa]